MKIDSHSHIPQLPPKKAAVEQPASTESKLSAAAPESLVELSQSTRKLQSRLDEYTTNEEVRPELVEDARKDLENWNGLSDGKIDEIMSRMLDEI